MSMRQGRTTGTADITSIATWPSASGQETATTTAGRQDESGHRRTKPSHARSVLPESVHQVAVDHSESRSELLDTVRRSGAFEVRMVHLATGDYLIDDQVLIERKTIGDLRASLVDGRLFPQVARLSHSSYRSLLLIEGPTPMAGPDVHPHSIEGALVSIAAMWRLPVLHSCDPEQSVRLMRFLADQVRGPQERTLRRFDRKPKRLASKRLFLLQGLPGVGPALAHRLLCHFGSIERILTADAVALARVRGIGDRKAAHIRELVADASHPSDVCRAAR
jgi:DNA excision repair protein ERCC-4